MQLQQQQEKQQQQQQFLHQHLQQKTIAKTKWLNTASVYFCFLLKLQFPSVWISIRSAYHTLISLSVQKL